MYRRILKEIKILDEKYGPIRRVNNIENLLQEEGFQVEILYKNIIFKYVFKKDYPFRPCKLYILQNGNYVEYQVMLKMKYMKYIYYSRELFGPNVSILHCPCCFNIHCLWHVSDMSFMMMHEYMNYLNFYKNIKECYYGKLSLKKYFNETYLKSMDHIISNILSYLKYEC